MAVKCKQLRTGLGRLVLVDKKRGANENVRPLSLVTDCKFRLKKTYIDTYKL